MKRFLKQFLLHSNCYLVLLATVLPTGATAVFGMTEKDVYLFFMQNIKSKKTCGGNRGVPTSQDPTGKK